MISSASLLLAAGCATGLLRLLHAQVGRSKHVAATSRVEALHGSCQVGWSSHRPHTREQGWGCPHPCCCRCCRCCGCCCTGAGCTSRARPSLTPRPLHACCTQATGWLRPIQVWEAERRQRPTWHASCHCCRCSGRRCCRCCIDMGACSRQCRHRRKQSRGSDCTTDPRLLSPYTRRLGSHHACQQLSRQARQGWHA